MFVEESFARTAAGRNQIAGTLVGRQGRVRNLQKYSFYRRQNPEKRTAGAGP
jgi:hypothetical protein